MFVFLMGLWGVLATSAAQIVAENDFARCEQRQLRADLPLYKDPDFFLEAYNLIQLDPSLGWKKLYDESPLLTTLRGTVQLMFPGPAREFKNFGAVARLYEFSEPRLRGKAKGKAAIILPIKVCGEGYSDSLGFVLEEDYKYAMSAVPTGGGLPPSTAGNPIPQIP